MLPAAQLAACEAQLGVPLTFAPTPDGGLLTRSAAHAAARKLQPDAAAGERIVRVTLEANDIHVHHREEALWADPGASHAWLNALDLEWSTLRDRASQLPAGDYRRVGEDNATWAWLLMAQSSGSLTFNKGEDVWTSRDDANPLALVRRAHARLTRHLQLSPDLSEIAAAAPSQPIADWDLRVQLALAPQASAQARRTSRSRTLAEHIGRVSSAALSHLERQPAERTDLHALAAARRLTHNALTAAGLSAPVPF